MRVVTAVRDEKWRKRTTARKTLSATIILVAKLIIKYECVRGPARTSNF